MRKELEQFIAKIDRKQKRADTRELISLMEEASGYGAYLTGSIIGFGRYHYRYASGREGESIVVGFSPRKQNITIYIMPGYSDYETILDSLGKYKTGKSCLYINTLADIDSGQLRKLVSRSAKDMQKKYRCDPT